MNRPNLPNPFRKTTIQMGNEAPVEIEEDGSLAVDRIITGGRWRKGQSVAEKLGRRKRILQILVTVLGVWALGGLYAASGVPDYLTVTVAAVTGEPTVLGEDGEEKVAAPGMRVKLSPEVAFSTDANSTLALSSRGVRLLLRANTALEVKTARYSHGAIRRLVLKQGAVIAQLDPLRRDAVFDVLTESLRVRCRGSVMSVGRDGKRTVVAVREGVVRVMIRGKKVVLPLGQQAINTAGTLSTTPASTERLEVLKRADEILGRLSRGFVDTLSGLLEDVLLPPIEAVESVLHLPTLIVDVKARMGTQTALQGIGATLVSNESAPESLKEISIHDKFRAELEGKKILYYQPLGGNKYELFAKAKDSTHTIYVLRSGKVSPAQNDEIPAEVF
jgi:hypothetical protein